MIDTMIKDGLWDAFNGYHMGRRPRTWPKWQITRDMQDEFALASQNKAEAAQKAGKFKDEIVGSRSRAARATRWSMPTNTSATAPRRRRCQAAPAFDKDGTVTAGNASGLNDGAAAVVLMTAKKAAARA
jgi:acetyl-CoA C-acetyltransferase